MKHLETFNHKYKGYGIHDSECIAHIYESNKVKFVLLQDIQSGTSVTNAAEQVATEVRKKKILDANTTRWFEIYPYYHPHTFDEIKFDYDTMEDKYSNPRWEPCKENSVNNLEIKDESKIEENE